MLIHITGPDGAVGKLSANELVGTGFTSRYQLHSRARFLKAQWVGVRPLHFLSQQPLTGLLLTTNLLS